MIARFSPVMRAVAAFAEEGGLVLGICNGFQVLAEAGLVPGRCCATATCGSSGGTSRSRPSGSIRRSRTPGARGPLRMPIAHGEGCYFADDPATLDGLEADGGVLFRYVDDGRRRGGRGRPSANPNGSAAGHRRGDQRGRQRGRAHAPPGTGSEAVLGSEDGAGIVRSLVESAAKAVGERRVAVGI